MQRALCATLALLLASPAAAVPMEFAHQGRLFDQLGVPLDGSQTVTFRIYDDAAAGNELWSETHTLDFDGGYFSAPLGSMTALDSDDFDGTTRYLAIEVNSSGELPTRIAMVSVPYAVRALDADEAAHALTADSATTAGSATNVSGGTVDATEIQINGSTVIDSSGALVGSLASHDHDATHVVTGVLDVARLPVGTGSADVAAGDHLHALPQLTGVADIAQLPVGIGSNNVAAGDHGHTAVDVGALPAGTTAADIGGVLASGGSFTGDVQLGASDASATTCSAGEAGSVRWVDPNLEVCDGSDWVAVRTQSTLDGSGPTNAALDCRTLKTDFPSASDGIYWLDPDGAGPGTPFQTECDMTTNGGGWTRLNLTDTKDEKGIVFTDSTCANYDAAFMNSGTVGYGTIVDNDPDPARGNGYCLGDVGASHFVWAVTYRDDAGNAIDAQQVAALQLSVSNTVFDGTYYHYDIDSPCGVDGLGPYGQPDNTGSTADGGGGFVIFPSRSNDPSTGSDYVLCDSNNPHGVQGGATDMEVINWGTIADGLMTHWGVQDRSDAQGGIVDWGAKDTGGGAAGVLSETYVWVR